MLRHHLPVPVICSTFHDVVLLLHVLMLNRLLKLGLKIEFTQFKNQKGFSSNKKVSNKNIFQNVINKPKKCWILDANVGFRFICDSIFRWVRKPRICIEFPGWLSWWIRFVASIRILEWLISMVLLILLTIGRASGIGSALFSWNVFFEI